MHVDGGTGCPPHDGIHVTGNVTGNRINKYYNYEQSPSIDSSLVSRGRIESES